MVLNEQNLSSIHFNHVQSWEISGLYCLKQRRSTTLNPTKIDPKEVGAPDPKMNSVILEVIYTHGYMIKNKGSSEAASLV